MYDEELDLEGIITDQPHLRFLGVIHAVDDDEVVAQRTRKQLIESSSRHLKRPTVFGLTLITDYSMLTVLPLSHHPGEALQECRGIQTLPRKYHKGNVHYEHNLTFNLLGITEGNFSLLEEVMEAMATCLRDSGQYCDHVEISRCDTTIQVSFLLSRCLPIMFIIL